MSSPSRRLAHAIGPLLALLLGAACSDSGPDPLPPDLDSAQCRASTLTYQNFAAPFVISWCRGCHGKDQPVAMRQHAPVGVDFDTAEQVRSAQARLIVRATGESPTMPPAGGPSDEERALLAEWLACGMK